MLAFYEAVRDYQPVKGSIDYNGHTLYVNGTAYTASNPYSGMSASSSASTSTKVSLPEIAISKLIKAKKAFTVRWTKLSSAKQKKVTGIQVSYSTSAKFTKKTTKTVKVAKTAASKKIKKLKSGKKYYVKIRTYKKSGSKTYYSAWSKVKTVKTK